MTPDEWKAVLTKIAPRGKPWIIDGLADALPQLVEKYHIDTPLRQAHFLAQVAHESDHFRTTMEYASGAAYEGRRDLGNTHKGDGKRLQGPRPDPADRPLQLRQGVGGARARLRRHPEDAAIFPWAAEIAGWYWSTHELNRHADRDDVRAATKAINGGLNGLRDRTAYLDQAKRALA